MPTRRQPSGAFFRRLDSYSESVPKAEVEPALEKIPLARRIRDSVLWLLAEVVAFIAVGVTLWHIAIDLEDRQTQRITQAWQLIIQPAPGNSGKGPALEYLASQGISLTGIDLSTDENQAGVFLQEVNLSGADLSNAKLSGVGLHDADLSGADLYFADLSGADLSFADLSGADLSFADLSGAFLGRANLSGAGLTQAKLSGADLFAADLSGADLFAADLSGANLRDANLAGAAIGLADLSRAWLSGVNLTDTRLTQRQLDTACGDEETKLPEGLTIKLCPDE